MTETPVVKQSALRTALAGLIGNVLEWFDFAVYGYFASNIGHQFFPKSDPAVQTFLTFGTFALGFFARPIGSIVLGRIGDRIGRRALLTAVDCADGRRHAGDGAAADLRPDRDRGADAPDVDARPSGLLAGRRVHGLDGLHHGGLVTAGARAGEQLDGRRHDDRLHPGIGHGVGHQSLPDTGRSGRVGLASPVHRQCGVHGGRIPAPPRHSRDRGGPEGDASPPAARGVARRRRASHPADLRYRRDDERGVLPDLHLRRRKAQGAGTGRRDRSAPTTSCSPTRSCCSSCSSRSRSAAGCPTRPGDGG